MTPFYDEDGITIYHGDCREIDAWDIAGGVMVTDPPYGRAWKQGDTTTRMGWRSNKHNGIANDTDTTARDAALAVWGNRPAVVFGDLLLPPPTGTRHVLIYEKGGGCGFAGAVGGFRRNIDAVYLINVPGSGLGGDGAVLRTRVSVGGNLARTTGHPHTKPLDVMTRLIAITSPLADVVDPFMGSGSTLVAARQMGRCAIGIELDERYCEIAAKRLAQGVLDFSSSPVGVDASPRGTGSVAPVDAVPPVSRATDPQPEQENDHA